MNTQLKVGNYIKLSEVPDEETYEKIKLLFKEAGCDHSCGNHYTRSLSSALGSGAKYVGYCKTDGYYLPPIGRCTIFNEEGDLVDESYYVPVTDLLPPPSPEEKISKILTEDVTFSRDFLVDLMKVYVYKGYLNNASLVMPSSHGHFHINLVFNIGGGYATISVNRESPYKYLQEEYSITIPLPH